MEILFEHLFREIILQRGYAYYIDQQVSELTVTGKTISASVSGSETYQVEIELNDEGIEYMSCDCPYFEGGDNCKHLAAVFYSLQHSESEQSKASGVKSELDVVGELLASLTYDELFSFLQEELCSNSALQFKFKAAFQHRDKTSRESSSYLQHIDSVFELHLGRRGYIEYDKAIDFELAVGELLSSVRRLIENEQYETSFTILKHLISKLSGLGIDDSLGTTATIMNEVVELFALIITGHSEPTYSMVFEWLCANLDGAIDDHLEDSLIDLFMIHYQEEAKLQRKIPIIDRIIACYDKPKQESEFGH